MLTARSLVCARSSESPETLESTTPQATTPDARCRVGFPFRPMAFQPGCTYRLWPSNREALPAHLVPLQMLRSHRQYEQTLRLPTVLRHRQLEEVLDRRRPVRNARAGQVYSRHASSIPYEARRDY